jgi:hypothetical protein
MEPLVRLIEQMPEDKVVAAMIEQLKNGLPYRHFLAALYLAAIRAARWHGDGAHGYDHNAYVVHSVYQLSLDLPAGGAQRIARTAGRSRPQLPEPGPDLLGQGRRRQFDPPFKVTLPDRALPVKSHPDLSLIPGPAFPSGSRGHGPAGNRR